jgi:hypothetical protein
MGDPLWGKVVYRESRQCWGVRGVWEGKRIWFSAYRSSIGQQVCRTKAEAIRLQGYISNEIAQGIFDPARYRKEKPLHVAKYAEEWLESVKPNPTLSAIFLNDFNTDSTVTGWNQERFLIATLFVLLKSPVAGETT